MTRIIDTNEFIGKRIALLLWQGPNDAAYAVGTVAEQGGEYTLEFADGTPAFPLEIDWLLRLAKVNAETYDLFDGADYVLSLSIGNLPESVDPSELTPTGLRWPDDAE